jgi:hypothetical protein
MTLLELLNKCVAAADETFGEGSNYVTATIEIRSSNGEPVVVADVGIYGNKPNPKNYAGPTPEAVLAEYLKGIGYQAHKSEVDIEAVTKSATDLAEGQPCTAESSD